LGFSFSTSGSVLELALEGYEYHHDDDELDEDSIGGT
jgi:hypothetical protein